MLEVYMYFTCSSCSIHAHACHHTCTLACMHSCMHTCTYAHTCTCTHIHCTFLFPCLQSCFVESESKIRQNSESVRLNFVYFAFWGENWWQSLGFTFVLVLFWQGHCQVPGCRSCSGSSPGSTGGHASGPLYCTFSENYGQGVQGQTCVIWCHCYRWVHFVVVCVCVCVCVCVGG